MAPQGLRHQLTLSPGGFFNQQMGKKNTFSLALLQLWQGLQSWMGIPGGAGASAGLSLFPGPSSPAMEPASSTAVRVRASLRASRASCRDYSDNRIWFLWPAGSGWRKAEGSQGCFSLNWLYLKAGSAGPWGRCFNDTFGVKRPN